MLAFAATGDPSLDLIFPDDGPPFFSRTRITEARIVTVKGSDSRTDTSSSLSVCLLIQLRAALSFSFLRHHYSFLILLHER